MWYTWGCDMNFPVSCPSCTLNDLSYLPTHSLIAGGRPSKMAPTDRDQRQNLLSTTAVLAVLLPRMRLVVCLKCVRVPKKCHLDPTLGASTPTRHPFRHPFACLGSRVVHDVHHLALAPAPAHNRLAVAAIVGLVRRQVVAVVRPGATRAQPVDRGCLTAAARPCSRVCPTT